MASEARAPKIAPSKKAASKSAKPKTAPQKPAAPTPIPTSLQHMPVSLYGAGLGLAGFATAWREAAVAYGAGGEIAKILTGIALGAFVAITILYGIKFMRHRDAVVAEFRHPVLGNFFSAATMTLLVLTANLSTLAPSLAKLVWAFAAIANVAITVSIVSFWISRNCNISLASPVWFLPVAGNLIIPIVGAPLGFTDLGWMLFAVGLLFWVVLFTIVFYRLLFENPIETQMKPTLLILIAPPSLCFTAYVVLSHGTVDGPAIMFLGFALFILLLLAPQIPSLLRVPFGLSWWSYVFPLATLSVACTLYADASGEQTARFLAIGTTALLSVIILIVAHRTVRYILAGKVFRPVEAPLPPS